PSTVRPSGRLSLRPPGGSPHRAVVEHTVTAVIDLGIGPARRIGSGPAGIVEPEPGPGQLLLPDARLRVVAHTVVEGRQQALPLFGREVHGVLLPLRRDEL